MKIVTTRRRGSCILRLTGPLVRGNGRRLLRASVDQVLGNGTRRLVLDLTKVAYLDAAGIGEIIRCDRRVKARGARMAIACPSRKVGEILDLAGVADRLPLAGEVEEALRVLRSRSGEIPHPSGPHSVPHVA